MNKVSFIADIVTYISGVISLTSLALTINTLTTVRRLEKKKWNANGKAILSENINNLLVECESPSFDELKARKLLLTIIKLSKTFFATKYQKKFSKKIYNEIKFRNPISLKIYDYFHPDNKKNQEDYKLYLRMLTINYEE